MSRVRESLKLLGRVEDGGERDARGWKGCLELGTEERRAQWCCICDKHTTLGLWVASLRVFGIASLSVRLMIPDGAD